jgi:hypothetical protein
MSNIVIEATWKEEKQETRGACWAISHAFPPVHDDGSGEGRMF